MGKKLTMKSTENYRKGKNNATNKKDFEQGCKCLETVSSFDINLFATHERHFKYEAKFLLGLSMVTPMPGFNSVFNPQQGYYLIKEASENGIVAAKTVLDQTGQQSLRQSNK